MLGRTLGSYRVLRLIGRGGMGSVYEGVHDQIGKRVAIKILHPHYSHNPQFAHRFLNEARAVNLVDHPGLVQIFEFGQLPDQTAFIVMEFLQGESLRARLRRGPMGPVEATRLSQQMAQTLSAAHLRDVIHRDLKPANVMIIPDSAVAGRERTKVLDFGIAKMAAEPGVELTESGIMLGTPTYMSPEQCRGAGQVTAQTDVYALGIVLYEMLTGAPPFVSEGHGDLIVQHLTDTPRPVREVAPHVSAELSGLVQRMLAKLADDRPRMREVAAVLERLSAGIHASGALPAVPVHDPEARTIQVATISPYLLAGSPPGPSGPPSGPGPSFTPPGSSAPGPLGPPSGPRSMAPSAETPHTPMPTGRSAALPAILSIAAARPGPSGSEPISTLSGANGQLGGRPRQRLLVMTGAGLLACLLTFGLWPRTSGTGQDQMYGAPLPGTGIAHVVPAEPTRPAPGRVRWTLGSRPAGAKVVRVRDGQVLGRTPWTREDVARDGSETLLLQLPGYAERAVTVPLGANFRAEEPLVPMARPVRKNPRAPLENKDVPIFR